MLRTLLMNRGRGPSSWRARDVSRIEGFSDAVFGFALTLLVVSLEVPNTSGELILVMRGFIPFTFTFGLLMSIWYAQFLFFRRYGLEDTATIALNAALLLVVMFFVYPLKFLIGHLVDSAMGWEVLVPYGDGTVGPVIRKEHARWLWLFYGAGFTGVWLIFTALYTHAWRLRDVLQLSEDERRECRQNVSQCRMMLVLGVCTLALNFYNMLARAFELPKVLRVAGATVVLAVMIGWMAKLARASYAAGSPELQKNQLIDRSDAEPGEDVNNSVFR